jgi:hypothetical protein
VNLARPYIASQRAEGWVPVPHRYDDGGFSGGYIGIAQNLKSALGQYSGQDQEQTGIDEAEAVRVLQEK